MIINLIKVFLPSVIAFVVGILFTPVLTNYLYKNKMWKKKSGKIAPDGRDTPIFNALHKEKEVGTPKLGGVVIWFSALFTIVGIWIAAKIFGNDFIDKMDFLSRSQTWVPLATLIAGSIVGLVDDFMEINGNGGHIAGGLSLRKRLLIVAIIGLLCGSWFYFKLDVSAVGLPVAWGGEFPIGWLVIPFFSLVTMGLYSGGVIDGLDGLAGGIFATIFAAYAGIAFFQDQINLAAFCALIVGAILAFLWFNIPPARFYMSETGSMGLTITLAVVAFMTDSLGGGYGIIILPIIAFPLLVTTASVIIQLVSKKFRNGQKVFLIAPLHHHFEALGWPAYKVVMRYWVMGVIFAIAGVIFGLMG